MKITIEIADDNKLIEAMAAEISRTNDDKANQGIATNAGELSFELTRAETSQLTCLVVSCGT